MRLTRAAQRAQAATVTIHEDDNSNTESSPDHPSRGSSPVLKEMTNLNSGSRAYATPVKPTVGKHLVEAGCSGSITYKSDHADLEEEQTSPDSTADSNISATDVEDGQSNTKAVSDQVQSATPVVSNLIDQTTEAAPKSASDSANLSRNSVNIESVVAAPKTPKFDSSIDELTTNAMDEQDDSFLQSIKSRTPGRSSQSKKEAGDDSFVEKITSRTPRRTSRIEDSVEAMDALEDAIEQFSGELPVLDDLRIDSPVKDRHDAPSTTKPQSKLKTIVSPPATTVASRATSKSPPKLTTSVKAKPPVATSTVFKKPATIRQPTAKPLRSVTTNPAPSKRISSIDNRVSMSFSNSPLKPQANIKQRTTSGPLSTSRPGFVPAKSNKAPTTSTFVLPGEVYAAKLKAEREAKQEEPETRKQFKARPVPKGRPSLVPRENKASQARMGVVFSAPIKATSVESTSKRVSSLDVAKVRNPSNSSMNRTSSTVSKMSRTSSREPKFAANVPRVASLSKPVSAPVIEPEIVPVQRKISGKQAFARPQLEKKKQEDEKHQKEEAAKKARAEAAERGRQASRDWAEKKAKMAAAQKAATK